DIVNHAKTLPMPGERVVESAADIDSETVLQCALCGENRTARSQPESSDGRLRIENFQAHAFAEAEPIVLQLIYPFAGVHTQNIGVAGGLGGEDIGGFRDMLGEQEVAHHFEFLRLENVFPEAQIVTLVIDELEWEHDRRGISFRDRG